MPRFSALSACAAIALTMVCAPAEAPAPPAPDLEALRSEVATTEQAWSAAYLAGDAAGVAAIYAEDGASITPRGEWERGRDAIARGMQATFDSLTISARSDVPLEVFVAGDYLVEVGEYSQTATEKKAGKDASRSGRYLVIWKRDANGALKIYRDIGNQATTGN